MQPEVAACETTSFPSTTSALTDDAPHMQGAWSCLAPLACADLRGATLEGAKLIEADLRGADSRSTLLMGARLQRALLIDADLRGRETAG